MSPRRPCSFAVCIRVYPLLLLGRVKWANTMIVIHVHTRMCMRYDGAADETSRARPINTLINYRYDDDYYYYCYLTLNVP